MVFFSPPTDEECREAVELLEKLGTKTAVAEHLGINRSGVRTRLKHAAQRGMTSYDPVMPGFRISSVSHLHDANGNIRHTSIHQKPELGDAFQLPDGHRIKGVSALINEDGREIVKWVKTREESERLAEEAIKAAFEGYEGRAELTPPPVQTDADLLSVYPVADVHHGLLSWEPETGENYDLAIGAERLSSVTNDLVSQAPPSRNALIINLGDYFHLNDRTNTTPASGNLLDVDGRFFKVATTGVELFCRMIDLALQKHEHVRVRCLPGNHDPDAAITLTIALTAFYRNEPRVTIEHDASEFFFHLFGSTLLGACHGHRMKPEKMAMAMATMRPEDWGKAKFRWFLYGHIHHESAVEVGDVRCESFQTLAAKDAWSANSGYVSGQSMSSVTLHVERGEIGRHRVNVPPAWARAA